MFIVMFYLYHAILSSCFLGYGVNRSVQMCNEIENVNPVNRDKMIKFLSNQMDRLLDYRREYREGEATPRPAVPAHMNCFIHLSIRRLGGQREKEDR